MRDPDIADVRLRLVRPAFGMRVSRAGETVVGYLGGNPALPTDLEWPPACAAYHPESVRSGTSSHLRGRDRVNIWAGPTGRPADRRAGGPRSTCMLLGLTYQLMRFMTARMLVRTHSDAQLRAEVLALQHQLRVLERKVGKRAWQPVDRILLAGLSRLLPRSDLASLLPKPETLLRWHRDLVGTSVRPSASGLPRESAKL